MEEDLDTYLGLTNPDSWTPALKIHAQHLRMFRVRQPYSLILAAHRTLVSDQFAKVLRGCVVIAFRYNVIGNLPTNEQERVYFGAVQKINQGQAPQAIQVFEVLQEIYPKDESFKATFADKTIRTTDTRNNRVMRYILCELEKQVSGQDWDFESDAFNVEHVLPQNPQSNWAQFSDQEVQDQVYRIGNMALLPKAANKDIGNASYADKRPVLAQAPFNLTRELADENEDWTPSRIASRQKKLAKLASTVWRINWMS